MREGLAGLLDQRRTALGIRSQAALRELLAGRGCKVSRTTMSKWFTGAPIRTKHLRVLLDVLDVHGAERDRAYRLAGEGGQ